MTRSQGSVTYPIPVHVQGMPDAFAWPDLNKGSDPDSFASTFKSLNLPKDKRTGLRSDYYVSPDRILEILGPINGTLALVTDAKRIDFLAMASKKIIGSMATPQKAKYYAGAAALFEYDSDLRALSRINVPDGARGARLALAANLTLEAIACGVERDQPMSLILERRDNERSSQVGDFLVTTWNTNRAFVVVNSETLQAGPWVQPQVWMGQTNPNASTSGRNALSLAYNPDLFPKRLVGSRNGAILNLREYFTVITPRFSVIAPYPSKDWVSNGIYGRANAEGSITGMVASNSSGQVSRNGILEDSLGRRVTPCGRYAFVQLDSMASPYSENASYEVRTIEDNRPLFRINRPFARYVDLGGPQLADSPGIQLLADNGPAVIQSKAGKVLQFIDLDIAAVARELVPDNVHVVSQPMPVLLEGGTYEYQIQVNHPALVTGYALRDKTLNATISPTGLFRFAAPPNVRDPIRVPVSIEILAKGGKSLLHEFSIIVISRKLTAPAVLGGKPPATPPVVKPKFL